MGGRVIVDGEVGGEPRPTPLSESGRSTRLGSALASPVGVLVVFPLLVALVGLSLTWVGQEALRRSSLSITEDRFRERTVSTGQWVGQTLEQAEPVLDRLAEWARNASPDAPFQPLAITLRDLIFGRPGMTQAYVAFPDGTFWGVYLEDGRLFFQSTRLVGENTEILHHTYGEGGLVQVKRELAHYDPRTRGWYTLGVREKKRVWTEPYPFFTTGHTGITRVEPLFREDGRLHAVVAVDFDVSSLSDFMADGEREGIHALVYGEGGTLLAYPRAKEKMSSTRPSDHALDYKDLDDPLLNRFFAAREGVAEETNGFWSFDFDGQRMLATVFEVRIDSGLRWFVASIAREDVLLGALRVYRAESLAFAGVSLAVALGISWLFARHIVRVRREVASARAQAEHAERRAMELGSYRLVSQLGKGGMGEVWRARHRLLAREAAIKLISAQHAEGRSGVEVQERFKREAQTIAALRSRNTVALYDYGVTQEGTFFYVMELLDGIDLESLVERYGPQPPGRVLPILLQACNSLGEAHDAGLVHRDVKPANLFLCRAAEEVDVVKVLDFGLVLAPMQAAESAPASEGNTPADSSTAVSSRSSVAVSGTYPSQSEERERSSLRLTGDGNYLGTPAFIAPEQALGQELDGRADLYALGCVAFWLLTGEVPFDEPSAVALLVAHMHKPAPLLDERMPGAFPAGLSEIVAACMAKDPGERPASARALASLLKEITLPPQMDWTEADAHAWWQQHLPRESERSAGTMKTVVLSSSTG